MNRTPRPFLDFDDAGASDEEPAKNVTIGDIRAWHDQYDMLLSSWADCRDFLSKERARVQSVRNLINAQKYENDSLLVCEVRKAITVEVLER